MPARAPQKFIGIEILDRAILQPFRLIGLDTRRNRGDGIDRDALDIAARPVLVEIVTARPDHAARSRLAQTDQNRLARPRLAAQKIRHPLRSGRANQAAPPGQALVCRRCSDKGQPTQAGDALGQMTNQLLNDGGLIFGKVMIVDQDADRGASIGLLAIVVGQRGGPIADKEVAGGLARRVDGLSFLAEPVLESFFPGDVDPFEKFVARFSDPGGVADVDEDLRQIERDGFVTDDQQGMIAGIDQRSQVRQFAAKAGLRIGSLAAAPDALLQPAARALARTGRRQHREQDARSFRGNRHANRNDPIRSNRKNLLPTTPKPHD
ncbi:MAG: hypothetical protein ACT6Q3_03260 [Sphingopyxis sp.]